MHSSDDMEAIVMIYGPTRPCELICSEELARLRKIEKAARKLIEHLELNDEPSMHADDCDIFDEHFEDDRYTACTCAIGVFLEALELK